MGRVFLWSLITLVFLILILFVILVLRPHSRVSPKTRLEIKPTPKPRLLKLTLAGDVMLGRKVMLEALSFADPEYPFRKVKDTLKNSDLVFVNLEAPLVRGCNKTSSGFKFCALPEMVQGLVSANIGIVNLANNHSLNYGKAGIEDTESILEANKIKITGLGEPTFIKKEGLTFGFLGYDFTIKGLNESDLLLVREAKKNTDYLIVGIHWGVEYTDKPTNLQRKLARDILAAGADIISGHHPHWFQGIGCFSKASFEERYISRDRIWEDKCGKDEKIVYYSLGNFVFDQMWSEETKRGIVINLIFKDGELFDQEILKVYIRNWGHPEFVSSWD